METYEKKYKELEGKIKKAYLYAQTDSTKAVLEDILSELKESEDEKIRKEIVRFIQMEVEDEIVGNKWIAWLEKQGKLDNNDTDILNRFSFYSYKDEPNVIYLSELYVNKERRNKGIGTKILEIADKVAASMGCNFIRLKTEIDSDAERLYKRNGYKTLNREGNQVWLEKQDNKPVNIDIESMVSSYKQRLESQGNGGMRNNPLVNMCLTAFKHGVEEVLQELNLKEFEKPQGESEDEKIRKELIEHIKANKWADYVLFQKFSPDDVIAWLEKQESVEEIVERCKKSWYNEGKIDGMAEGLSDDEKYQQGWHDAIEKQEEKIDNANKVEPKFHEGEWIVWREKCYKVNYNGCGYELVDQNGFSTSLEYGTVDENAHLWDITNDAIDGDILATSAGAFIYNGNNGGGCCPGCYCGINTLGNFKTGTKHHWTTKPVFPATKEQHDTLMKAMADKGWQFDFEKKELKKIEPKFKVKYAGSEYDVLEIKEFPGGIIYYGIEDEPNHIDYVLPENCEIISCYGVKEKGNSYPIKSAIFSQQSSAWSEEDEDFFNDTIAFLEDARDCRQNALVCIDWLKSLKDRYTWKPSDEQITALEHFVRGIGESGYVSPYDANLKLVHSLLNDLKRLK